ncbi:MAG: hypothetical protein JW836_09645 [Deltaproteobacteria bacterium]|nr:hypothetical protein [Deltaproteobacteria bacterium]
MSICMVVGIILILTIVVIMSGCDGGNFPDGCTGNAFHNGFDRTLAIPCGAVAVAGDLVGSAMTLRTKPNSLKPFPGSSP